MKHVLVNALALLSFAAIGSAVEPGRPSKTAIMAAVFRALGAKNPDPQFRNPDFLAARFIRKEDLDLLAAAGGDYRPQMRLRGDALVDYLHTSIAVTTNYVRTVHIDTTLLDCVKHGASQVVILGAGLDSRAYRLGPQLPNVTFFEVDFPPTQAFKERRVRQILDRRTQNARYVPMDFTKDDLLTKLKAGGYQEDARTFFVWEGVVMYIPEAGVRDTLRFVARHSASGSQIVFDYPFATNHRIGNPNDMLARWGEPFVFGFPPSGPAGFIRDAGLRLVSDDGNADLVKKYAVRADGTSSLHLPDENGNRDRDDAGFAVAEVLQ